MSSKTMRDELRKVLQDLHGYEVPLTGEVTLDADLDYQNKLTSNEIETALTSIINLVDKEKKQAIEKSFIPLSQMYDEYSDECFHLGMNDDPRAFFRHEKVTKYISELS